MDTELKNAEKELKEEARRRYEAKVRQKVKARAKYSRSKINPFDILDVMPYKEQGGSKDRQPTVKQIKALKKFGVNTKGLSFKQASQLIKICIKRCEQSKCTFKQAKLLRKFGYSTEVGREQASKIIDAIARNGWRRPETIDG